jgi:glycosyltransferase involved in cell wall biosynthesis
VDHLGDEINFRVLTSDRDFGDVEAYPNIVADSWQRVGKAEVFYLSRRRRSLGSLRTLLRTTKHDLLYLNSLFSPTFSGKPLLLRRLGLVPKSRLILAPRGELSPKAIMLKALKKRVYLSLTKMLGFYRDVVWQASSEYEERDIRFWFGGNARVVVTRDLPPSLGAKEPHRREKTAGSLKLLFLSRVSRIKNLIGALELLKEVKGKVALDVYGPLEDKKYWAECQRSMGSLPKNVRVKYCGSVEHHRVVDVMAEYDLFFLPSLGENFGHVILEALLAGCPVLISDRTLWRNLRDRGVGWDLPLGRPELFRDALQTCVEMNAYEHQTLSQRARTFGLEQAREQALLDRYRELFWHRLPHFGGHQGLGPEHC